MRPTEGGDGVVAGVGRELGADRVSVFENVRDADGRLWMNLAAEWCRDGVRGIFDEPATKLHPYSPDFTRWIEVLGEAETVEEAVRAVNELEPDVVLLDVHMPGGGGVEVIGQVSKSRPQQRFLALSVSDDPKDVIAIVSEWVR